MASSIGSFTNKRKLTITTTSGGANIANSLTDFPVCIHINSSSWTTAGDRTSFFGAHNSNGKRVQFFGSDQTTNLAYEVDRYDSANEIATYWVKVPTVAGNSTTDVYVAYGNDPNSSDQDQATSVWDSNFVAVYHLQSFSVSSPYYADSKGSYGIDYTGGLTEVTTAPINSGRHSDGSDDYCQRMNSGAVWPWNNGIDGDPVTMSCWCTSDTAADHQAIMSVGANASSSRARRSIYIYNGVYGLESLNQFRASAQARTTDWKHVAAVVPTPNGKHVHDIVMYIDGASSSNAAYDYDTNASLSYLSGQQSEQPMALFTAAFSTATHRWHGQIDEARFSKSERSADWIKGEYWSMKKTSWPGDGWITWSASEASGGGDSAVVFIPYDEVII